MTKKNRTRAAIEQFETRVALAADFGVEPFTMDEVFGAQSPVQATSFADSVNWEHQSPEFERQALGGDEFGLLMESSTPVFLPTEGEPFSTYFNDDPGFLAGYHRDADLDWPADLESSLYLDDAFVSAIDDEGLITTQGIVAPHWDSDWFQVEGLEEPIHFESEGLDGGGLWFEVEQADIDGGLLESGIHSVEFVGQDVGMSGFGGFLPDLDDSVFEFDMGSPVFETESQGFEAEPIDLFELESVGADASLPFFEELPFEPELAVVDNGGLPGLEELDAILANENGLFSEVVFDPSVVDVIEFPVDSSDTFFGDLLGDQVLTTPGEVVFEVIEEPGPFRPPVEESLFGLDDSEIGPTSGIIDAVDFLRSVPLDLESGTSTLLADPLVQLASGEIERIQSAGTIEQPEDRSERTELGLVLSRLNSDAAADNLKPSERMTDELRELAKGLTQTLQQASLATKSAVQQSGRLTDGSALDNDAVEDPGRVTLSEQFGTRSVLSDISSGVVDTAFVGVPINRMYGIDPFDVFDAIVSTAGEPTEVDHIAEAGTSQVSLYESTALLIGLPVAGVSYAARAWRRRDAMNAQCLSHDDCGDEPTVLAIAQSGN
ncbi:MAG: hypothetical protein AAGG44_00990 [Planctomycetota bacterium]